MQLNVEYPVRTENLSKMYVKDKYALNNINIKVKKGKITGFLGPNGAGKTTTIKLLLGLLKPTSGSSYIFEELVKTEKAWIKNYVGYLPEFPKFPGYLTPKELLNIYGNLLGMDKRELYSRIDELLNMVELEDVKNKKMKTFSKGMLQRIGIASALLNSPPLYILDEPTSGLDIYGQQLIKNIIKDLNARGDTIFMSSHLLKEVQEICSDVIILNKGKVIWSGSIEELTHSDLNINVSISVNNMDDAIKLLKKQEFIKNVEKNGNYINLYVENKELVPDIANILVKNDFKIYEIKIESLNIEDAVLNILRDDNNEN
ncbi:MAG: ABC transporter ATP-binding protein [Thermoplasmata archaeon]|jgi:ABC-2 type transport system ATP-binding protein